MKGVPQDMAAYKWIFSTCRIPQKNFDATLQYTGSRHIVVLAKSNFYAFDVVDEEGSIMPRYVIER